MICETGMSLLNCLIILHTCSDYAHARCVVPSTQNGFAACVGVLVFSYVSVDFLINTFLQFYFTICQFGLLWHCMLLTLMICKQ